MDSSIISKSVWWMRSVLYITGNRLWLGLVLSYKTPQFVRCFLYRNFHELACTYAKSSNTYRHTGILSLLHIIILRKWNVYSTLIYVIYTHFSNFNLDAILKRKGVIFMFNSSEEVARGWNLFILSTSYSYLLSTYSSFSQEYV